MVDRGHCFLKIDDFEEYDKFYDFTKDNEQVAKRLEKKYRDAKFGVDVEYVINREGKDYEEEDEWVDIDSDCLEKEDSDIKETKTDKPKSRKIYKLKRAKLLDTDEILLPSGKILGHKKYLRYYKQRIRIRPENSNKMLTSGRYVYGGKLTKPSEELMTKESSKSNEITLKNYQRFLMRQKMKNEKHLKKNVYNKRA